MKSLGAALTVAGMLALMAAGTDAGSAQATLNVSATVANNCTISTAAIAFGSYDPVVTHASTALDSTGTVTIACTKGANTTIELGLGANASGSQRRMKDSGTNYLNYELYQPDGFTTVWGLLSAGNAYTPAAAPSKAARSFTVNGRVAAGQDVPAGSYSDTVVATVNF
ncbi:MAG: spore coat protein U domain-containing protein [Acidobacteria bacterium]|nr:spore coat protein U domain-containing protein [Acidobacteriota bacterium]